MSKYRIYELAKEFNTTSKVIIDILARNNMVAKNHMSSVDDEAKAIVNRTFARKTDVPEQTAGGNKPVTAQNQQASAKLSRENKASTSPQQRPTNSQRQQQYSQPQRNHSNQPKQQSQSYQQTRTANNQAQRPSQTQRNYGQGTQQPRPSQNQQHSNQPRPANAGFRNQQRPDHKPASTGQSQQNQRTQVNTNTNGNGNKRQQNFHNQNRPQGRYSQNRQQSQYSSRHHSRPAAAAAVKTEHPTPKLIKLGGPLTVKELAGKIGREVGEVIKKLMMLGIMASINQEVDLDTATILAGEFGTKVEELPPEEDPTEIPEIEDDPATLVLRPPVVTVMGHVDHGKTSLLDVIRRAHVTAHEAGGITQHIGAYQVVSQGKKIVFLDTPGHEAFTAMRARGAQVTDIAVLVVAADDGVMPQTIEAINHAKSAKVPIIVAINKMDRPGANPDRVKQQLGEHGLIPEDWGGDTIMVPVSAHQKTGITELLDMILLVAEMQEIKANPNRAAFGTIIEAQLDKGRGPVATVLVQKGTLRIGDSIIAGTTYGKVRAMINDRGEKVKKAEPSTPVEVLGLADVPEAGDVLAAVEEKVARSVAEKRIAKKRTDELMQSQKVSLDDLFKQIQEGNIKDLNIVVKADVQGSIEALNQSLLALNTNKEVRVSIVHAGVGAINESDVLLASAANALIIGFNVRPDANARKAAETEKIDIRTYRVIYEAINDVEAAMTGMLAPQYKEVIQGRVEIRKVFTISKVVIAGAYVLEGKITSTSKIRIIRDGIVVHEGELESLRRFKDDVKEVAAGYECGISVEKYRDLKEGDIIEVCAMEEVKPNS
ncbi:MAG: translation initiation factor IF-2 [Veillonellales bacterium]